MRAGKCSDQNPSQRRFPRPALVPDRHRAPVVEFDRHVSAKFTPPDKHLLRAQIPYFRLEDPPRGRRGDLAGTNRHQPCAHRLFLAHDIARYRPDPQRFDRARGLFAADRGPKIFWEQFGIPRRL